MKSTNVMKSHVTGFGRRSARAMLFGLAALVPVVSMGVTVPSALGVRGASRSYDAEVSRLSLRSELVGRLGSYTEAQSLDELSDLASALRGMVPSGVRPLQEFALIRAIAAGGGVQLDSIRPVRTHAALSLAKGSGSSESASPDGEQALHGIVIDEVVVTFKGSIEFGLELVSTLRESGYPIIVFGFELARSQARDKTFASELRLGFLRRVGT